MASKGVVFGLQLLLFALSTFCQEIPEKSPETSTGVHQNLTLEQEGGLSIQRSPDDVGYFFMPEEDSLVDDEKIAGGKYASDGQFPFMAVVHQLLGRGKVSQCGGTIISKRWVLTAAHCIRKRPRKFFVVFGVINKAGIGYDYNSGPGVSMMTRFGTRHPRYQKTINDIGLLYMPRDIPFTNKIQPIRLAGQSYTRHSFSDRTGYIIGWGKYRKNSQTVQDLKYSQIPIISNPECRRFWNMNSDNMCTAPRAGADTCEGDSGGPLIVVENGNYLQVGIVSYGDGGCPSSRPAVYTRVTAHLKWIYDVTGLWF